MIFTEICMKIDILYDFSDYPTNDPNYNLNNKKGIWYFQR